MKYLLLLFFVHTAIADTSNLEEQKKIIEFIQNLATEKINGFVSDDFEFEGVELLVAEPNEEVAAEKYGHAMLRFVGSARHWKSDYVLSLGVENLTGNLSMVGTFTGQYSVGVDIKKMDKVWEEYVASSHRVLSRYIIPSTKKQRKKLLANLKSILSSKDLFGSYNTLLNNCITIVTELLSDAGFAEYDKSTMIPTSTLEWVDKNKLTPYYPIELLPRNLVFDEVKRILGISKEDFNYGTNWPADSADKIEFNLFPEKSEYERDKAIKSLMVSNSNLPYNVFETLISKYNHNFRNGMASQDEAVGYLDYPALLYQICEDEVCIREQQAIEKQMLSQQLKKSIVRRYELHPSSLKSRFRTPQVDHLRLYNQVDIGVSFEKKLLLKSSDRFCFPNKKDSLFIADDQVVFRTCFRGYKNAMKRPLIKTPLSVVDNVIYFNNHVCGKLKDGEIKLNETCVISKSKNHETDTFLNLFVFE